MSAHFIWTRKAPSGTFSPTLLRDRAFHRDKTMKRVTAILLLSITLPASADIATLLLKGPYGVFRIMRKFAPTYKALMVTTEKFPRGVEPLLDENGIASARQKRNSTLFSSSSDLEPFHMTEVLFEELPINKEPIRVQSTSIPQIVKSHVDGTANRMSLFIVQHMSHLLEKAGLPSNISGEELLEFVGSLEVPRPIDMARLRRALLLLGRNVNTIQYTRQGIEKLFTSLSDLAMIVYRYAFPTDASLFVRPIPMSVLVPGHREADFITFVPIEEELHEVASHIPHGDRNELVKILQEQLPILGFEVPSEEVLEQISLERMAVAVLVIATSRAGHPKIKAQAESILALKKTVGKATGLPGDFFSHEAMDFDLLIFENDLL